MSREQVAKEVSVLLMVAGVMFWLIGLLYVMELAGVGTAPAFLFGVLAGMFLVRLLRWLR